MNTKKIITYAALAVIILLAVFWSVKMFTGSDEPQGGVVLSSGLPGGASLAAGNIAAADDPFITLLNGIKNVDLSNLKLLSDPIFVSGLKDLSRPVSDRGRGRENPFAQIGVGNLSLSDSSNQTLPVNKVFQTATSTASESSSEIEPEQMMDENENGMSDEMLDAAME